MMTAADTLLRNDSLRRAAEQLFLQGAHFGPADSLSAAAPPATATDLFGPVSSLAAQAAPVHTAPALTSDPLFQVLVLLLTGTYILLAYHHAGDIRALFSRSSSDSAGMSDLHGNNGYTHFLSLMGLVGLLAAGVLTVKGIDLLMPPSLFSTQTAAGVSLIVTAILLLMVLMQTGMLLLIGAVTLTGPLIRELNLLRSTLFAVMSLITVPAVLCLALSPGGSGLIWLYIIAAELIITVSIFLAKSLRFFISKKISILHWFLYLCTVEIFPVSLLWLLIARE